MLAGKSPGPYGFKIHFFKEWWSAIKEYIWKLVEASHNRYWMHKNLNATFLTLIPKKEGTLDQNPISIDLPI